MVAVRAMIRIDAQGVERFNMSPIWFGAAAAHPNSVMRAAFFGRSQVRGIARVHTDGCQSAAAAPRRGGGSPANPIIVRWKRANTAWNGSTP